MALAAALDAAGKEKAAVGSGFLKESRKGLVAWG